MPTFAEWRFPHDSIPASWRRDPTFNASSVRRCRLSHAASLLEDAHIVPRNQADEEWFNENGMAVYSEEIVLLRMLTAEPARPQYNAVVDAEQANLPPSLERKLSLQRELDIVDNLTFVCATSGNPEHVIALCIEEGIQSNSCTFRIAMNIKVPKELMDGIRAIAQVVEKAASRSKWYC